MATFSDELGEWTAAQVTGVDASARTVGLVDLDWSGPEPSSVGELLDGGPLIGVGAFRRLHWQLPRGYRVIGNLETVRRRSSGYYASEAWDTGWTLFEHRMRSADPDWDERSVKDYVGETRLNRSLSDPTFVDRAMLHLTLTPGPLTGPVVDCEKLVRGYPNLVSLTVWGIMARLENAGALNRLSRLRRLDLTDAFGMSAEDAPDPSQATRLEDVRLESVPAGYAAATRQRCKPFAAHGVSLSIQKPRPPEWVAQNQANPLRGWEGREGITTRSYAQARAAWNQTTPPIIAALIEELTGEQRRDRLHQLGADFARAFDEVNQRSGFIETEERDELLDGLAGLIAGAPVAVGVDRSSATDILLHAVNEARTW